LNEHLTRIVASCEPRGQSYEVERLLEAAREIENSTDRRIWHLAISRASNP
jgi:hypothetical protein